MQKQLLIFILFFVSFSAASQDWQWAKEGGGPNYSESKGITTDANGNSYTIGNFANSISFGTITLNGGSDGNIFIVKHSSSGQLVWAKQMSGTSVVESMDIASDATGNTYITGNYKGTVELGGSTLTSLDDRAAFTAKLDTEGNVLWARQAYSTEGDVKGESITVDATGNVYVAGDFFGSATFGATAIRATKDEQLFITKYNNQGEVSWVKMAGGLGSCTTHAITTDQSGNLYLAGQFWMTASFGATTLTNYSDATRPADIFLAKYDANGNALWAKQAGGTSGNDVATGITVDEVGDSYITGYFQNRATFESSIITGNADGNVFLAKYSAAGDLKWLKKQESSGDARAVGIGRDATGNLYIAGHFEGSLTFEGTALVSAGSYDMFFIKYAPNTALMGAVQAGGAGLDLVKMFDVSEQGSLYFTGEFQGPATFGSSTLEQDVVVGKLNSLSMPKPVPTITTGDLNTTILCVGATIEVPFSITGHFGADNVFTVQLSNSYGSFVYPTVIGSGAGSPITATIPVTGTTGPGYRIRVVASSPKVNGTSNSMSLTFSKPPVITALAAERTIEVGASTNIYASGADAYEWYPVTGLSNPTIANPVASPSVTTTYTVTGNKNGCSSVASVTVRVEPVPPAGSAFEWSSVKYEATTGGSLAKATVTDDEGNVYVSGEFSNSVTFGSATLTVDDGGKQTFVVKYNAEGEVMWAQQLKSTLVDMAMDAQGNLYLVGSFLGTVTFGEHTVTASNGFNYWVAKFNSEGAVVWLTQVNGLQYNISAIAVSPAGELYTAGAFKGNVTFNDLTLASGATNELFVVKYSAQGKAIWGNSIKGSSRKNYEIDLATDVEGAVYMTSSISVGTLEFNSLVLTNSKGGPNAFISKYQANGHFEWAKLVNQNQEEYSETVSSFIGLDKNKNVYLLGRFNRHTEFEAGPQLTAVIAGTNGFLAKYDTDGSFKWVTETGGSFAVATGLTMGTEGNIYVTGLFRYTASFGAKRFVIGNTQLGKTDYGLFVVKYDVDGNTLWAEKATTSISADVISSGISVDKQQNIYIVGSFDRSGAHEPVNFGCQTVQNSASAQEQYYVAKLSALSGVSPTLVTGNIFGGTLCAGSTIEVPFSTTGSKSQCASYAVLLSDTKGSFEDAKIIGTGAGADGKITAIIPTNIWGDSGYRIKIIGSAPAVTGTNNGANITIAAQAAVSITASTANPCPGATGVTYTASSGYQMASYAWAVPEGWVITEGQGTNKIKVTVGATAGDVIVTVPGECGQEVKKSFAVVPASVLTPSVEITDKVVCGSGNVVFTASGAPYGATYRWYSSATGAEPIWEDRPYSKSSFYTPVVYQTTSFYVSLRFSSGCESERVPLTITVRSKPGVPERIIKSGEGACTGMDVSFEVPAVSGASGYEWRVPYGWQIISGQHSSRIVAKVGATGGVVSVAAYNSCGYSEYKSITVASGVPVAPTTVGGSRCGAGTVTLNAFEAPPGGIYRWYQTATGGTAIAEGANNAYVTPALTSTTTYYVSTVTAGGCESTRTAVTAIINSAVTAYAGPDEELCIGSGGFLLTGFSPAGGAWTGSGITSGGYFEPVAAGAGTHKLTYTVAKDGCTATAVKNITVMRAPVVTMAAFEIVCNTTRGYVLTGGQPAGGVYSGIGVENGVFSPVDSVGTGVYVIAYTYANASGCTKIAWQNLTVTTCTGLPESKLASELVVYPNPTTADLMIDLPLASATAVTLRLFDLKGQKLHEKQYSKQYGNFKQVMDLRRRPKGIYLLQLILDDGVISKKVVVE